MAVARWTALKKGCKKQWPSLCLIKTSIPFNLNQLWLFSSWLFFCFCFVVGDQKAKTKPRFSWWQQISAFICFVFVSDSSPPRPISAISVLKIYFYICNKFVIKKERLYLFFTNWDMVALQSHSKWMHPLLQGKYSLFTSLLAWCHNFIIDARMSAEHRDTCTCICTCVQTAPLVLSFKTDRSFS